VTTQSGEGNVRHVGEGARVCPVCHRPMMVKQDGTMAVHHNAEKPSRYCEGSGQPAVPAKGAKHSESSLGDAKTCGAWIMHEGPCALPEGHDGPHDIPVVAESAKCPRCGGPLSVCRRGGMCPWPTR
jgi:hypothetical protein